MRFLCVHHNGLLLSKTLLGAVRFEVTTTVPPATRGGVEPVDAGWLIRTAPDVAPYYLSGKSELVFSITEE